MHIENESAEIVTTGDHEFEEIIEEYEEEILMQEEVLKPTLTDSAEPAQGKPRFIMSIFHVHHIYICVVHLRCRKILWKPHAYIYLPYEFYWCRFE